MTHLNPIIYSIQFHIIQTFFPFSFQSKPNWLLQIHLPYAIVGSKPKSITAVATWGMLLVTMFRSCPIENPTKKTPNYNLHVPFSTSVVCHIKFIKLFDRLLNFASNRVVTSDQLFLCVKYDQIVTLDRLFSIKWAIFMCLLINHQNCY